MLDVLDRLGGLDARWIVGPYVLVGLLTGIWCWRIAHRDGMGRPSPRRVRKDSETLRAEIENWSRIDHRQVVLWLDHVALDKPTIIDLAAHHDWHYCGQDMTAAGWPLRFTRDPVAGDVLAREQAEVRRHIRPAPSEAADAE